MVLAVVLVGGGAVLLRALLTIRGENGPGSTWEARTRRTDDAVEVLLVHLDRARPAEPFEVHVLERVDADDARVVERVEAGLVRARAAAGRRTALPPLRVVPDPLLRPRHRRGD